MKIAEANSNQTVATDAIGKLHLQNIPRLAAYNKAQTRPCQAIDAEATVDSHSSGSDQTSPQRRRLNTTLPLVEVEIGWPELLYFTFPVHCMLHSYPRTQSDMLIVLICCRGCIRFDTVRLGLACIGLPDYA